MRNCSKSFLAILLGVFLAACSKDEAESEIRAYDGQSAELGYTPTLVVASFGASGDAESGPYALRLMEISSAVAAEFGSRTDWQVMEGDRVATLEEELDYGGEELPVYEEDPPAEEGNEQYAELAGSDSSSAQLIEYARAFPTADYVLIGTINGFDVAPVRDASRAALSSRSNRIRSNIQYRIVETATRRWIASDSIVFDETFSDDGMAETQVNAFLRQVAEDLTTSALRKLAGDLVIEDVTADGGQQSVRISGGRGAGLQVGDKYRVAISDTSIGSAVIEVVEVFPSHAIAIAGADGLQTGMTFEAVPVLSTPDIALTATAIRLGLTPCLYKETQELNNNWAITVRNRLAIYFQGYDSVELVEDRAVFRDAVLGQQILDDLSKKREVGLPLGSLRGVDYLAVCNLESVAVAAASVTTEEAYGVQVQRRNDAMVLARGSAHIIDVNSATSVAAVTVDTNVAIDAGDQEMVSAADRVAQKMFGALMTALRPMSIVLVADDVLILNHKSSIGVSPGDEYVVFQPGRDIVDTTTGETLRNVGGAEVGRLRVTGFDSNGWIKAQMLDGAAAEAGMLLRAVAAADRAADDAEETIW